MVPISGQQVKAFNRCCGQLEQILDLELDRDPDLVPPPRVGRLANKTLVLLDLGRIAEIRAEIQTLDTRICKERDRLNDLRRRLLIRPASSRIPGTPQRLERKIGDRRAGPRKRIVIGGHRPLLSLS